MKKFGVLIVAITCIILTGCGNETLKCSKIDNTDTGKTNYNVTINFSKGKISSADVETIFDVNDDYKDYYAVMADRFKEVLKVYDGKKGIKTNVDSLDNKIKTNITFNLSRMSDKDKNLTGFDYKGSKKNVKAYYEKEGFSCK